MSTYGAAHGRADRLTIFIAQETQGITQQNKTEHSRNSSPGQKYRVSQTQQKYQSVPTDTMDLSYSLDILFMVLAFFAVRRTLPSREQINAHSESEPPTPSGFQFKPQTFASPYPTQTQAHSPVPSPVPRSPATPLHAHARRDSLAVPQITLTSDLVSRTRPKHGRKAVSFSLSSMDELANRRTHLKRPPTPYTLGPGEGNDTKVAVPTLPLGVEQISASLEARDGMGVKKEWLMPR